MTVSSCGAGTLARIPHFNDDASGAKVRGLFAAVLQIGELGDSSRTSGTDRGTVYSISQSAPCAFSVLQEIPFMHCLRVLVLLGLTATTCAAEPIAQWHEIMRSLDAVRSELV